MHRGQDTPGTCRSRRPCPGEAFELLIGTRPQITNFESLPAAVPLDEQLATHDGGPFEPSGAISPVVGGVSFTDAATLKPGRYTDSLRPGEQLI